jgi:hypothetical protein
MQIKDLRPNQKNPRKISDKKLDMLKRSLVKFGDLSGFVYNRRTKQLVSGHQRGKALPSDATINIDQKFQTPTKSFTVAEGHVLIDGERFKYREVDAPREWEVEALLAANKHSGEWDRDLLRMNLAEFPTLDIELAGFEPIELKAMNIDLRLPTIGHSAPKTEEIQFSDDISDEETDEEYVRNTPETEERIDTENIPSMVNAFGAIEESTEIVGKRHMIMLDCPDAQSKDDFKAFLRSGDLLEKYKAKIF